MNTAILIQARTDSERFPNKVLQNIDKYPMLWHQIKRCKFMNLPIIVVTTKRNIDEPIIEIAKKCNVKFFRGSIDDVLDRFYQTAKKFSLEYIMRITADCPLIDPKHSILTLEKIIKEKIDYVALDDSTYPDGLDTEIFTFDALEKAWGNAKKKSEREHVTPYILEPKNNFVVKKIKFKQNLSHMRWTVDYKNDLDFVREIYSRFKDKKIFFMNDIIEILNKNPEIQNINSNHQRNERYAKS